MQGITHAPWHCTRCLGAWYPRTTARLPFSLIAARNRSSTGGDYDGIPHRSSVLQCHSKLLRFRSRNTFSLFLQGILRTQAMYKMSGRVIPWKNSENVFLARIHTNSTKWRSTRSSSPFQAEIESPLDGRVFNYTFIEGALDLSLDGVTQSSSSTEKYITSGDREPSRWSCL